jgi:type I restriction enzyme S subunit
MNEVESYQRVIDAARAVVETYRPGIPIRDEWPLVELGEVVEPVFGKRITRRDQGGTKYPVYGGGGESFRTDKFTHEDEVVVSRFAMSPECVRWVPGKFYLLDSGFTVAIRESALRRVHRPYLVLALLTMQDEVYACGRGHAQKNIDIRQFKALKLPLPPIEIQQSIAADLSSERETVEGNRWLVDRLETKIQAIVSRVWDGSSVADLATKEPATE